MSNNAAERELRAVAVGRRNWTFAGSDEGGRRAAAIYTLIASAKLNNIDPQAWLADVEQRLALCEAELADRHARLVELERAGQDRWKAIQAIAGLRTTQAGHERRRGLIL